MRKYFHFLLVLLLISSCAAQNGNVLSPKDFKIKMSQPSITLIDMRTAGEYKAGHLEKAMNINVNSETFETECSKLDKSKTVLVYCLSGKRSQRGAEILRKKGYRVLELSGGIEAWREEGLPVVK